MGISISGSLTNVPAAAANASTAPAARNPQPVTNPSRDTVTLTESQQVYQLYNQGQRVTQIATSLSLPLSTVNNYLGISNSS